MKKLLLFAFFLSASLVMTYTNVNAQPNQLKGSFSSISVPHSEVGELKTTLSTKGESRALKNFSQNYKKAGNVSWHYSGKILVATFSEGNTKKRVMYLNSGQWLRTLIQYDESELSDYVKSMVKRNYSKFDITGITEVHEKDIIAYFINIEDVKEIKQVIAYEDQVWTHMQFRKR
jgi:hypothetical protein